LTFLNVLRYYFICHEKSGHVGYSKKRTYGSPTNNATHMRPVQNLDAKSTSNE